MARSTSSSGTVGRSEPFVSSPSIAGVNVTEATALNYSAVWAAVNFISNKVSVVPWGVYEKQEGKRSLLSDHRLHHVLSFKPNPEMGSRTFRKTLAAHVLLWGNGYGEIEARRNGDVEAIWPIEPHRMNPDRDSRNKLVYEVSNERQPNTILSADQIYHVKGLSYDGLMGYSPVRLARDSLSLSAAMERYGSAFFGNGANPGGVLEHPGNLSSEAAKGLRESWEAKHKGVNRSHKVAILEEGMSFKTIGIPPEDAQFLSSRQFQITEIARWFQMPPHKLAELTRATFSNIEQQSQEVVDDCIVPWVVTFEEEADLKLFKPSESGRLFTKMNLKALLRGDSKSRGEFYQSMFSTGAMSVNRILELEDENPIGPEGDLRMVPMNMVSVEQAYKEGGSSQEAAPKGKDDAD
ncbi:phage portal protein [Kiloniella antarctica]|uniref:Phage portal protein n=1 Tax=Kiloniella antarctica TaxID=1550907 RepID=A0ABW5BLX6_9PROT